MKNGEIRDSQLAIRIAEEMDLVFCAAEDGRLSELSVTSVEMKSGGSHYIVIVSPSVEFLTAGTFVDWKSLLQRAEKYLRSELAEAMNLKRPPNISFVFAPRLDE